MRHSTPVEDRLMDGSRPPIGGGWPVREGRPGPTRSEEAMKARMADQRTARRLSFVLWTLVLACISLGVFAWWQILRLR